ncbi:hypothetical protein [Deinococcus aerolatus]|uniref:hypothetical protein n=1 Tax=Deinococcus aerolatus TaxID=522487 RepID=UPI001664CDE5|nr:hypothetical protein [Deinococcus aerolatus]
MPDDRLLLQALVHGDAAALLLLHGRYAGCIGTLAEREGLSDPGQAVEDAFMLIFHSAGCFARSELPPAIWIVGTALWHFRRMRIDAA